MECPRCSATTKQHKIGFNRSGSQKYRCRECGKTYTPFPKVYRRSPGLRRQAARLRPEGHGLRGGGRIPTASS